MTQALKIKHSNFSMQFILHMTFLMLVICLVSIAAHAEENPFASNYLAQNNGGLLSRESAPNTQMLRGKDQVADNTSMLENGFDLMGSSGFEAGEVAPDLALTHAKQIKADQILIYVKAISEQTASSRIQSLREKAKKKGGVVDEEDLKDEGKQYKYFVSYWAKLPPPLLGLHVVKLKASGGDAEEAALLEKGLKVIAVIKDSPAENANLIRGDLLLKIADVTLEKPEELSKAVVQNQGKTVEINYVRDGQTAVTQATINKR